MRLTVMTPDKILAEIDAHTITARGGEGSFTLLPGHVDLLTRLERSILSAVGSDGNINLWAVDGGILVKQAYEVIVSAPLAVAGGGEASEESGAGLAGRIDRALEELDEETAALRTEGVRMETDLVRRMVELGGEL